MTTCVGTRRRTLRICRRAAKQLDTVFYVCPHGGIGVEMNTQVANGTRRVYEVLANPGCGLRNLMLSSARSTPEDLRLGGIELESITLHPQCDIIYARRHLHLELQNI